jgi:hypothetical protein
MPKLGIVIFGCLTKPKYRQQIEDCFATWVRDAIQANCIVRFYTDSIPDDLDSHLKEYCINLNQGDNYLSATFKQWKGFEHIFESFESCDFYYTCGTDTFLNVRNTLQVLERYDSTHPLYIGGGMGSETIGGTSYEYFSGGAGFFLSHSALQKVLDALPDFMASWFKMALEPNVCIENDKLLIKERRGASDLQAGILCKQEHIEFVCLGAHLLVGDGTHNREGIEKDQILSCHYMLHTDFYEYWNYLQETTKHPAHT